jgi:AsmA-like protein
MSRRSALVTAVAAGVAAALLAALLLVEFDASALGAAVLARAGAALGVQLTARSFRLRPLTGLVLEDVHGSASFTGGRATVSLDRLVLDHRFWRLLLGEIVVDRLLLQGLHVQLVEAGGPPSRRAAPDAAAVAAGGGLGRMALRVSRIDVRDGTIELQTPGAPRPVVLKGLDLRLRDVALDPSPGSALAGLAATGEVVVAEIALPSTRVRDLRGSLRLGHGRLQTDTVRFRTDEGAFQAEAGVSLDRLPLAYTLSLRGQPLDMARILGTPAAAGFGPGSLRFEARGAGTTPEGVQGTGSFRMETGTLGGTPLLEALDLALGRPTLVGARYQPAETPFRIEHGRVAFDRLLFQTDRVALQVGGWASLQGPLDLSVSVRAPRREVAVGGLGAGALDLLTGPDGNVVIPFKVTGTQAAPKVQPDLGALAAQTKQGAARSLLDKASRGLGALLTPKRRD